MASKLTCHLLELPAELRAEIYCHVFNELHEPTLEILDEVYVEFCDIKDSSEYESRWGPHALLSTCKTIYEEAMPLLYCSTTFRLALEDGERRINQGITAGIRVADSVAACSIFRRIEKAKITIYSFYQESSGVLAERAESLVRALDYCRQLKEMSIHFSFDPAGEDDLTETFEKLRSIECNCEASISSESLAWPRLLEHEKECERLAAAIGG